MFMFFFYFSHAQLLLNDQSFVAWEPVPYFWFAFHWLAMSHSCYNPVIYCYMNARFRGGFMQILHHVPFIRRCCCMRNCTRGRSGSFGANFALTGEFCARARFVIFLITFQFAAVFRFFFSFLAYTRRRVQMEKYN